MAQTALEKIKERKVKNFGTNNETEHDTSRFKGASSKPNGQASDKRRLLETCAAAGLSIDSAREYLQLFDEL